MSAELHCRRELVSAYLRLSWQERRNCEGDEDQRDPDPPLSQKPWQSGCLLRTGGDGEKTRGVPSAKGSKKQRHEYAYIVLREVPTQRFVNIQKRGREGIRILFVQGRLTVLIGRTNRKAGTVNKRFRYVPAENTHNHPHSCLDILYS